MARKGTQEVKVTSKGGQSQAIVPARVFRPFEEFDRLFDRFFGREPMPLFTWRRPPWDEFAEAPEGRLPGVDVIDRGEKIVVRAEVPGVDKETLDVSVSDNVLTIKGSVSRDEKEETADYYRREIARGAFSRRVTLPASVDASKADAALKDGVLEVTLPKAEGSTRHSIKVQ